MCAYAILALVVITIVKEIGWRGAPLIAIGVFVLAIGLILPQLMKGREHYFNLIGSLGVSDIGLTALKIIGLGYLGGITSDICSDMGEMLLSKAVVLVCRIEIVLVASPYFFEIVKMGVSLI